VLNKDHLLKGTRMGPPSHKEKRRWTEFLGSYNREPIWQNYEQHSCLCIHMRGRPQREIREYGFYITNNVLNRLAGRRV
jgi:hypothetical protein